MQTSKKLLSLVFLFGILFASLGSSGLVYAKGNTSYTTVGDVQLIVKAATDPIWGNILQVQDNVSSMSTEIGVIDWRVGQLEGQLAFGPFTTFDDVQGLVNEVVFPMQATIEQIQQDLSSSLNFAFMQIGGLESRVSQLEEAVSSLPMHEIFPSLLPGDLELVIPSDIYLTNGHELTIDNYGLSLPGNAAAKVDADFWFRADLNAFEPNWGITLIPLAGQSSTIGYLKTDIPSGSSFQVTAYAFFGGRVWSKTLTVHQP